MTKFFRLVDKMPGGKMWVRSIFLGCFGTKKQEACIMRLYKKAAAVLLAAAMAVSMMTACGGGAGGGSGAVSGVTYTSDAALAAGVDADSTTLEKVISQSESRYLKLSSDLASTDKVYEHVVSAGVSNGVLQGQSDSVIARNGKFVYLKAGNGASNAYEELFESSGNGSYLYTFLEAGSNKAAVRLFEKNETSTPESGPSGSNDAATVVAIRSAQVTVKGSPYYAEIIRYSNGITVTACFEGNKPVPTYDFTSRNGTTVNATVYKEICIGGDKNTIENRLSGYTVYTATLDSKTKGTLKNETTGVTYDVTLGEGEKGYTVKQNGQPTNDINWLIDAMLKAFEKS